MTNKKSESKRPNLLFVFADQLRSQALGCYGNEQVKSDNFDKFASEGVKFENCFANSPVCTPSRGSILTGNYPLTHGAIANDIPINKNSFSIGNVLKNHGYETGYIGKYHLDGVPRDGFTPPGKRRLGFKYWRAFECNHDYMNGRYYENVDKVKEIEGYEPIGQTDMALNFIRKADEPWALFLSWGPPHDPYGLVPDRYLEEYDPKNIGLRDNVPYGDRLKRGSGWGEDPFLSHTGYYAHITALDEQFGRLMHTLKKLELESNTLVVFTSDHGDMLWSHSLHNKRKPFEESISVPLMIKWPEEIASGETSESVIGLTDLAPSLLSSMGLQFPEPVQGKDLSQLFKKPSRSGLDSCFIMEIIPPGAQTPPGMKAWRGVRTKRYTYARHRNGDVWVLFDNKEDPCQLNNLAGKVDKHSRVLKGLETSLKEWLSETGDDFLPWRDHVIQQDLVEAWNDRERHLYLDHDIPGDPTLLE